MNKRIAAVTTTLALVLTGLSAGPAAAKKPHRSCRGMTGIELVKCLAHGGHAHGIRDLHPYGKG